VSTNNRIVFLNGEYLPIQQAKVSVLDRGFLFGDGVYEVIPVYAGRIFRFSEHLSRLRNSLAAVEIKNPYTDHEWEQVCNETLDRNPGPGDKSLYLQITRGVGEREHLYTGSLIPTVFIMCKTVSAKVYEQGITAITQPDIRWLNCHIKAITLLPNIMLRQLAFNTDGSYEAILIRDGVVMEGAASNVFVVKDGKVSTPIKDGRILPGITRDLVVELLQESAIGCVERVIHEQELVNADEIWLTGSLTGVAPVVKLDGVTIGDGKPGKMWLTANRLFENYKLNPES